jgi:hypothetical protein
MHTHHRLLAALVISQLCIAFGSHAQDLPKTTGDTIALEPVTPLLRKGLDLRPPKITDLYSQEAIDGALRLARDPRTIEEVEVEGRRYSIPLRTPDIPGGPLAIFWALLHPTQSWRILLPMAPDQAEAFSGPPQSATDPYRPPSLPLYY